MCEGPGTKTKWIKEEEVRGFREKGVNTISLKKGYAKILSTQD